ncbi:MAG: peptidylprolyl isomerase [Candidatus Lambdaproteobacteria bacterium RIFOXYD2_FULL_50_16]|uniref:Peptidyl-prolyl cis-trans isomerase n=1 Tax=Candidatus Lambdaproteobacteria bacterium RIFOXYD2_FULL_50_16 TaxID=1817772 RepID=A0A1F6GD76_9PROT|nr:MAG: peptidylprolyl isomerase [Candidatus Lambdaproteobacteria bacterium RIFOXYD2_FULL_50_16]
MSLPQLTAHFETSKGLIRLRLFSDQCPVTVASFVNLIKRGYYDGLNFHRVIPDFMVQGGCPTGTGTGGPGYRFEDECNKELKHNRAGTLSMANAGPKTNGSQFFITHGATPWLDGKHTVFGEAVSGEDVKIVNLIKQGDQIKKVTIEGETGPLLEQMKDRVAEWNKTLG